MDRQGDDGIKPSNKPRDVAALLISFVPFCDSNPSTETTKYTNVPVM